MAIYNLGSLNIDLIFAVDRFPAPGETLTARGLTRGLGGKGANQSVAAARAGATVYHIGAVGEDGVWMKDALQGYGVDVGPVAVLPDAASGQASVYVEPTGENMIVIHIGANGAITGGLLDPALAAAGPGDWLILQNETNFTEEAARAARNRGMKVAYSAAPFSAAAVDALLGGIDLLVMNDVESRQLAAALPGRLPDLANVDRLITMGKDGARLVRSGGEEITTPGFAVDAVDTTGAGDTFLGTYIAALDGGCDPETALRRASAAAAIQVTKRGASSAIPDRQTVDAFLEERGPSIRR
ncbi:MAG: ribokinase [Alphaproteobacteria bacterium]